MQTASNWNDSQCDPLKDIETIITMMTESVGYTRNRIYEDLVIVQIYSTWEMTGTLGGKKTLTLSFEPNRLIEPAETIATILQAKYYNLVIKAGDNSISIEGSTWQSMLYAIAAIADYIKLDLAWEGVKSDGNY